MKKSLKKGGVGDVVTLIIIIGLALALLVAVVIPMVNKSRSSATKSATDYSNIDSAYREMTPINIPD